MAINIEKDSCQNCGNCKCGKKEPNKEEPKKEESIVGNVVGGVVDFAGDVIDTIAAIEIADTIGDVISGVADVF